MYIYNVSIQLEQAIEKDWLQWMYEEHLNDVMQTGCFYQYELFELLLPNDQTPTKTYIVKYFANTMSDYERYIEQFASQLRDKGIQKFQDRFIGFRTLLRKVE
ncbi:MAG: DUF4286 family protein [Chitinophagaceae bacterium]